MNSFLKENIPNLNEEDLINNDYSDIYLIDSFSGSLGNPLFENINPLFGNISPLEENELSFEKILDKTNSQKKNKISYKFIKLPPVQYSLEKIKNEIFIKFKEKDKIIKMLKEDEKNNDIEEKMNDITFINIKKRNRKGKKIKTKEAKKSGRHKKDEIQIEGKHNKYSQDNIIKKIKSIILKYLIKFINDLLKSRLSNDRILGYIQMIKKVKDPEKEDLIKNLNYDLIVNSTEKENNLKFLKMALKDFLSTDISNKLKTYSKDSNKKVIDKIIKEENDTILNFILNDLTLNDWIDIFLYKRELKDLAKNLTNSQINEISNLFIRVDNYILDNYYIFDNNYFSSFIILFYNLERWYYIKEGRKKRIWSKNN